MSEAKHGTLRTEICQAWKTTKAIAFGSTVSKAAYDDWRLHQTSFQHPDPHYFVLERCLRFLIHGTNIHPVDDGVEIICDRDQEHEYLARDIHQLQEARLRQVNQRRPGHPDPQRLRVSDLAECYEEPQFIAGIKQDCPLAVRPFMSREIIDIELKVRNRLQDEET